MRLLITFISTSLLSIIIACSSSSEKESAIGAPQDPSILAPPSDKRAWLTKANLESNTYPHSSPIHNGYFMPVGIESPALEEFSGTITISNGQIIGNFSENYLIGDESFKNFPNVDFSFFSNNGKLIPINRDRQVTLEDDSFWGIILDPGKVWSEADDNGWSRASFPFTFISARRNNAHNGLATFLYKGTEISHLRIQIVQETALWFKNDMMAQLSANYETQIFAQRDSILEAYLSEVENTVMIKDWSELEKISSNERLTEFNSNLSTNTINQTALIKDNEVYLQPCYTRYGNYPYCRWMRNGAYSMTKSMGMALTTFRLAEKYGTDLFDLKIGDYLNVTASHSGWDLVTFGNVLSMAVGIGDLSSTQGSGEIFADENQTKMETWIAKNSEIEKLSLSFSYGNYTWGPGVEFRYNSALHFVLAAALDNYYKNIAGENADLWQMIIDEVFLPIGIQHVPNIRTIETDDSFGIAELFHGLYLNVDDMAKISMLLQNEGSNNGVQLLHKEKLKEALFRTEEQGLHSWWEDNQYGESRYLHGFWTSPFGNNINCLEQIPYMSGYGGNMFAILPNGISLFRFSDSESYTPSNMIKISNIERSICPN
ncbi:MAG: hypothetical protein COB38_08215 [Gammaproteobacteria bacterium]|nr:MAG: hypothetical protein COB38_08215 [Gammaproteobacteria bacterium]